LGGAGLRTGRKPISTIKTGTPLIILVDALATRSGELRLPEPADEATILIQKSYCCKRRQRQAL